MRKISNKFVSGVDIEEIVRFKKLSLVKDRNFLDKIYTKEELMYCFGKTDPSPHLAGRFAGKEAVFKALSGKGLKKFSLKKIEILANIDGVPEVCVLGLNKCDFSISLSISHCKEWAVAFVIITEYEAN